VASITVNYTPLPGNFVVVGLCLVSSGATSVACADNNSNTLIKNLVTGTTRFQFYNVAQSGAISYTCSWSSITSFAAMFVGEYTGGSVVGAALQTINGNSTAPSITVTPLQSNSLIIATIGWSSGAATIGPPETGAIRLQVGAGAGEAASTGLIDNVSGGFGVPTTVAATISNSVPWQEVAFELEQSPFFALDDSFVSFGAVSSGSAVVTKF
jgi:hypothetical protein